MTFQPFTLISTVLTSPATETGALGPSSISRCLALLAIARGILVFVKETPLMPIGTVKFFNVDKGYGFIAPEGGGNDSFVHITAVEQSGMATLTQDQRVSFELETDRRGKQSAVNLKAA